MRAIALITAVFLVGHGVCGQSPASTDATKSVQLSNSSLPATREFTIEAGTAIDIEAMHTLNSRDMLPGDFVSFCVLVPIQVDGVTVIEKGSLVTGRVVEAKRGGHWGKAGRLSWIIQDVVAADLTRVSLQAQKEARLAQNGVKGASHAGQVAAQTVVFGALLFPISPLALMSGFKRGEDAILPQGKRFVVYVANDTKIRVSN